MQWLATWPLLLAVVRADDVNCADLVLGGSGTLLGRKFDKCFFVSSKVASGSSTTTCSGTMSKDPANPLQQASIDNRDENEFVADQLMDANVAMAFNGYASDGSVWQWQNGDKGTYTNFAVPPPTIPPGSTPAPPRSTLPPSQQRKAVAIVIAIDASLFCTNAFMDAELQFTRSLVDYISARGFSEFAIFPYGCTQLASRDAQYPRYVSTYEEMVQMVNVVRQTVTQNCVRTNPLDFPMMFNDINHYYYNRFSQIPIPSQAAYISVIFFSSTSNSTSVKQAVVMDPLSQSSIIAIALGQNAVDVSRLSVPPTTNSRRVLTPDAVGQLVQDVDGIIFAPGSEAQLARAWPLGGDPTGNTRVPASRLQSVDIGSEDATSFVECAYINVTDKLWYSDGSCTNTKRQVLCQYQFPPVPTQNPTISWSDPCPEGEFKYYPDLANAKCYRVSEGKRSFAELQSSCLADHPLFLHDPQLTSVESELEHDKIADLASNTPDEGMFWFGLRRNSTSSWFFINNDPFGYSRWRDGYPRECDGCDCVALVVNDNRWINTDCNKNLFAICAFRYNSTS